MIDLKKFINEAIDNFINEIGGEFVTFDDTLVSKIMKKLGIQQYVHIGECGSFGCVFDIGNNQVLKLSTDQSEAIESNKIKGLKLNCLANIFNVYKVDFNKSIYYIIICEKLKTEPKQFKVYYYKLNKIFREKFDISATDILVDYYQEDLASYNSEWKTEIDNTLDINSQEGRFYYQLLAIIDELRKYGIQSSDYVNYKNLGYKSNGNLGFFDIGFGDTNPNYEPERLNIHERKISYMPNSKTVEVKQKCKLGGNEDGTSEPCNQGDMNNLNLKSIS